MQVVILPIAFVIGFIGYKEAEKFEKQYGRGPWGGSALMWGILCFLFGLFGALFLYIAQKNTKKQLPANANTVVWTAPPDTVPASYGMPAAPPPAQWGPPPSPGWAPPSSAPPPPPGPPAPNVGGSDFLPGRH